jgi:hypothetical protein
MKPPPPPPHFAGHCPVSPHATGVHHVKSLYRPRFDSRTTSLHSTSDYRYVFGGSEHNATTSSRRGAKAWTTHGEVDTMADDAKNRSGDVNAIGDRLRAEKWLLFWFLHPGTSSAPHPRTRITRSWRRFYGAGPTYITEKYF